MSTEMRDCTGKDGCSMEDAFQTSFSCEFGPLDALLSIKLHWDRFGLDIRKYFFLEKVVKHWYSLLRGVVESPSLKAFKKNI